MTVPVEATRQSLGRPDTDGVLLRLHDRLRELSDPQAILETSCRMLGETLAAGRVHYVEYRDGLRTWVIDREWTAPGVPVLVGQGETAAFGGAFFDALRADRLVVIDDVRDDPLTAAAADAYLAVRTGAAIAAPLVRDGMLIANLSVDHPGPRAWTGREAALVVEVASRTWDALERARAEIEVRVSEAKYRALFESIDAGFCIVEMVLDDARMPIDYRILEANAAFETHTGLRGAVGRLAREAIPGLEDHWVRTYGAVALTGEPVRVHQQAAGLDGRWFDVYAFRVGDPAELRVGVLFTDVTERRRLEAERAANEARFRALADAAPAIVWTTDPEGRCTFLSRGWYDYTGQTEAEALGMGWLDAIHPDDRASSEDTFLAANTAREPFELDHRVRAANGEYRWIVDAGRPRIDADGAFAGFVGSVIDVDRRKRAETALREADRRKDEFLAMLAHELRNPLAPVRNALEVLRRERTVSPTGTRSIAMAARQLAHMRRLLDDLLDASRVSRGAIELRRERVRLDAVVAEVVDASLPEASAKRLTLHARTLADDVVAHADPVRIAQIVGNLVGNAIKYTPDGGEIVVETRDDPGAGEVELRVRDTGLGLAPERIEQVFELFSQVAPRAGEEPGGLGIGLALVRRIAELHGGSAWAESEGPGCGSTFVVRLPRGTT